MSLQCERLDLRHVLHGQTWLIPDDTSPASYLAGSTYDRDNLDCRDQGEQRAQLEQRLQRFLLAPFSVTGQRSGVRPTTIDQKPLLGAHPHMPHLWVFNGLGSKGALLAPWSAAHLACAMLDSHPVDRELDWLRGPA